MKLKLRRLVLILPMSALVICFQNCGSAGAGGANSVGASAMDASALNAFCDSTLTGQGVLYYDSLPSTSAPAVTYSAHVPANVTTEHIAYYGNTSFTDSTVRARALDQSDSFIGDTLLINAVNVGNMNDFSLNNSLAIAARSIGDLTRISANTMCLSAQSVNSISHTGPNIVIFGRGENGQKAVVHEVRNAEATLSFRDVQVDSISQGTFTIRVENGVLKNIDTIQADITLVNSRLETAIGAAGTIHLVGTSSIGDLSRSNFKVVQE
jgi:hypothetical protein